VDLKLNRAKDHFFAPSDQITAFQTDPESYSVALEHEAKRGMGICRVADVRSPPAAIGVGVGECLHQYRSALDHLLFQLVVANRKGRLPARVERRAEFPIFNSGPRFRRMSKRKGVPSPGSGRAKIQDIAPEAQAVIERLQPYHRRKYPGTRSLRQLQELSNIDKHRLLHVTYSAFKGSDFEFEVANVAGITDFGFRPGPLKRNAPVATWRAVPIDPSRGMKVDVKIEITTDITFGKASPAVSARGRSVVKTLFGIGAFIASDVLPPLCDVLGLASEFQPGKLIDVDTIPLAERDATAERIRIANLKSVQRTARRASTEKG